MNPIRALGLWLAGEKKNRTTAETLPQWQLGRPYTPNTRTITTAEGIKGMRRAGVVHACIRLIADAATSVPLRAYKRVGDEWEHAAAHPLQALIDTPNAKLTRRRLYYRLVQHLMLAGNGLWFKIRVPKSGPPTQLWPINPDLVKPIPDERDFTIAYQLKTPDGREALIPARDVIHLQLENPETPWWGLGPLQAAMLDVNLYAGNKAWNLRTVERGAVTPGVLELPDDLSDEQYKQLRKQLDERSFGHDDAGRELILGSGMKYHRLSLTGEELGFLESLRFGREEIAMIFGVPPAMLTPDNATLANVTAYNTQFWDTTIVPLNTSIADILTQALVPDFAKTGEMVIEHDYSQVPAMQDSLDDQSQVAERLVRTGFTVAGVNRLLDLGFEEDEIKTPAPAPNFTPHEDDEEEGDEGREEKSHPRSRKAAEWNLEALHSTAEREREAWEAEIAPRIQQLFNEEADLVTTAFLNAGNAEAAIQAVKRNTPTWEAFLATMYVEVARHFAQRERDRILEEAQALLGLKQRGDALSLALDWARRESSKKVVEISSTTEEGLRRIITEGLTPGEDGTRATLDEIAARIKTEYGITDDLEHIFGVRTYRIARTEVGFAMDTGHQHGARIAAAEHDLPLEKGWSAALDERTRDAHAAMHGEIVPLDAPFSNGLQYPHDPNGPASEVVNCRCTVFHRVAR